ncbi:hypothetical protein Goarm_018681 [Gossypium armourianum]|uniref:Proteoglycan 4-like n=1 Tax=Gossypium armourianum TaxID=34283 RepID=A0A7J9IIB7_9ROSI|nr:hypothetical protein [Gossypium armourianum]
MSNQPAPTRPWFRLTSISRSPPQEPAPAPRRPATLGPAFRPPPTLATQPNAAASPPAAGGVSSVTTSPVGRASQPSSPADKKPTTSTLAPATVKTSSVSGSPVKTVSTTSPAKPTTTEISPAKNAPTTTPVTSSLTQKSASPVTTTSRMPSPKASTTTAVKPAIQNQIQSPKTKLPTARPTSPLTLPLSQMKAQAEREKKIPAEADEKTVLVQKMIDKPKGWLFGDTRKPSIPLNGHKEPFKEGETKEKGRGNKYSSDSEDAGMRIITITGDNKGAFMKIFQSPHKNEFQGQKKANSSSGRGEAADGKMKAKRNLSKTMSTNAFINSNVQGINNSIVYNSSCTQHDPGVHLALNTKPTLGGFHVKEHTNGYNS